MLRLDAEPVEVEADPAHAQPPGHVIDQGIGRNVDVQAEARGQLRIGVARGELRAAQQRLSHDRFAHASVHLSVVARETGGVRVALVKHAHHDFDVDLPGKDSYRLRHAGCIEVLVSSRTRWALMHELRGGREPSFDDQLARLSPCDLLLVEGFKYQPIAKLEVYRAGAESPPLHPGDPNIVAVATDAELETRLPVLDLNDDARIASFILGHLKLA